jgi:hypothetical protein
MISKSGGDDFFRSRGSFLLTDDILLEHTMFDSYPDNAYMVIVRFSFYSPLILIKTLK